MACGSTSDRPRADGRSGACAARSSSRCTRPIGPRLPEPNDRVLEWAAAATGGSSRWRGSTSTTTHPEARRALAKGARGIELHPRAQAFTVDDARLEPVFALAEEERLPVLIHAGRGMPPIGEHLAAVAGGTPARS